MANYSVEPKSRAELRSIAQGFRAFLKLENTIYFPIEKVLETMPIIFPNFNWEIVDNSAMPPQNHADTNINSQTITIKQDVYDRACAGAGRDRMTIAHEIGHYLLLCVYGFKLHHTSKSNAHAMYTDPEWQAKCFAGELLIPAELVDNLSITEIATQCGVSIDAARYQYNVLHKGGD